ncbi:MAG: hypothetical protein Q8M02_03745 [Candidatus Didemnitutus sp.]|nr:hypothetical protein [Candidatus Didemnitutus sp.]
MTLTPEQKQTIATWIAAGDNLSEVQKKLAAHFQLSLTYRDVRFLVDDLDLALQDPTPKVDTNDVTKARMPAPSAAPPAPAGVAANDDEDEFAHQDLPGDEAALGRTVSVDVDRIVRPGSVVSGSVTFSDGVSGKWALDQQGRLMLDTGQPTYKPSAADVKEFQQQLSLQLQRHGY